MQGLGRTKDKDKSLVPLLSVAPISGAARPAASALSASTAPRTDGQQPANAAQPAGAQANSAMARKLQPSPAGRAGTAPQGRPRQAVVPGTKFQRDKFVPLPDEGDADLPTPVPPSEPSYVSPALFEDLEVRDACNLARHLRQGHSSTDHQPTCNSAHASSASRERQRQNAGPQG